MRRLQHSNTPTSSSSSNAIGSIGAANNPLFFILLDGYAIATPRNCALVKHNGLVYKTAVVPDDRFQRCRGGNRHFIRMTERSLHSGQSTKRRAIKRGECVRASADPLTVESAPAALMLLRWCGHLMVRGRRGCYCRGKALLLLLLVVVMRVRIR